uniref:Uncharacterized protein n=1 Tax=Cacopsylla melanoneura TaxID=428564 RepID=A0A8D8RKQ5_9HEMI
MVPVDSHIMYISNPHPLPIKQSPSPIIPTMVPERIDSHPSSPTPLTLPNYSRPWRNQTTETALGKQTSSGARFRSNLRTTVEIVNNLTVMTPSMLWEGHMSILIKMGSNGSIRSSRQTVYHRWFLWRTSSNMFTSPAQPANQ